MIVSVATSPAASVADNRLIRSCLAIRVMTGTIQRVVPRAVPLPPRSLVHVTTAPRRPCRRAE